MPAIFCCCTWRRFRKRRASPKKVTEGQEKLEVWPLYTHVWFRNACLYNFLSPKIDGFSVTVLPLWIWEEFHAVCGVPKLRKLSPLPKLTLPSGKLTVCYGKWPFIVDFPIVKIVIFHSYVSLPEGKPWLAYLLQQPRVGPCLPGGQFTAVLSHRSNQAPVNSDLVCLWPTFLMFLPASRIIQHPLWVWWAPKLAKPGRGGRWRACRQSRSFPVPGRRRSPGHLSGNSPGGSNRIRGWYCGNDNDDRWYWKISHVCMLHDLWIIPEVS